MPEVSFRTNVLLKSILGKDLITDDNIAVLELVKNSFDAGSNHVDIIFKNIIHNQDSKSYRKINNSKLIIFDTGKGMTPYDIENKWLNIAYSEKKEKNEDYGRTMAGNKGVGRFSCDRLGKFLTIYTRQIGKPISKIFIDWRKFEQVDDIDLNIQDIKFSIEEITDIIFEVETNSSAFRSGTYLEIKSLREEWGYNNILSLKRQLERLINPNQSFKASKFDIFISAKEYLVQERNKQEFEQINGAVKNRIFEKLNFKVTNIQSKISANGENIITILKDRGKEIFSLIEKNPFNLLKDVKIHIYYLNTYGKAYFTKQTGIRSVEFGSISLFINGFRIPPYGDFGNDWLNMELRKSQGRARHLGTREVIGRIEVKNNQLADDENNVFKIISSRSGIVNNDVYEQLVKNTSPFGYYYKIFRRLERFVVEGIKWDSIENPKEAAALEKEILTNPKWKESNEKYAEDALTRNKRVVKVVQNIVDIRPTDLVKIKINQNFITELLEEQSAKVESELDDLLAQLDNKELTPDQITAFLEKIDKSRTEINSFSSDLEKVDLALLSDEYKDKMDNKLSLIDELQNNLLSEREKRLEEENKRKQLEEELKLEKDKNTYLLTSKRSLSEDAKGLIHNVKLTSKRSKQNAQNLYDAIKDGNFKKATVLKWASEIIYNSDKALKISNLITRANFKANADYQDVNIVAFIEQYLSLYNTMYEDSYVKFTLNSKIQNFIKRISVLDLSLVLDDLISNSVKASAKNIELEISNEDADKLTVFFTDDGVGVDSKFLKNSEVIFDLGVTTTDGSGIGLNYVRRTLSKMQGSIEFIGNGISLMGARFKLTINKAYK